MSDPIRKEVYGAVAAAKRAGIGVKILTGDHTATAAAIARELGLITDTDGLFEANKIEAMTDADLKRRLGEIKVVARSTPATKLRIVKALRETGGIVAVTGDGINDAPAVKAADVGIAMGRTGTEVCKEAAGIVVLDDSFSTIVNSIRWGRGIYENFQRFILFQLTVNISAVTVQLICILCGAGSPFNALQLLWINMIMDGPPALVLGLEPIYKGLMERKPVPRGSNIVTKAMAGRIVVNALFIAAVLLCQAFTNFLRVAPQKERTALFTLFIVFQLFNAFNARELGRSSILKSFLRNKAMLIVMAITFAVQIVIVQFGGGAFGVVPLSFVEWLMILALGASIVVFNEVYKVVYRK
jgi:Ca2+-transporting ATPase